MKKRNMYLLLTIFMGAMFAFILSFSLLGRVGNILLAIVANIVIGGQFFYYGHKLSKSSGDSK